eukprot:scaffold98838_cov69-Phaeocystis_antarctica.AAC.5
MCALLGVSGAGCDWAAGCDWRGVKWLRDAVGGSWDVCLRSIRIHAVFRNSIVIRLQRAGRADLARRAARWPLQCQR